MATFVRNHEALLSFDSWASPSGTGTSPGPQPMFITYSFPTRIPTHVAADEPKAASSWETFSAAEQNAARAALRQWGNACGIVFLEVAEDRGDILFNWLNFDRVAGVRDALGYAYFPNGQDEYNNGDIDEFAPYGGDIFLNSDLQNSHFTSKKSLIDTLIHEIGHAIGFKHPHDIEPGNRVILAENLDSVTQTVMSYDYPSSVKWVKRLGPLDIAAAQAVYGPADADGANLATWSWSETTEVLTMIGRSVDDRIIGTSVADLVYGQEGNDRVYGLAGNDTLEGGIGDDRLLGGVGNDTLNGNDGNDTLRGYEGDDILIGGHGTDNLQGGQGADRFAFIALQDSVAGAGRDVVTIVAVDGDLIDLSAIDANSIAEGDQAFGWADPLVMDAPLSGAAGQLRFSYLDGVLQADVNGDAVADFEIFIAGTIARENVIL